MLSSCSVFLCQQENSADDGVEGEAAWGTGSQKMGKSQKEIQGAVI